MVRIHFGTHGRIYITACAVFCVGRGEDIAVYAKVHCRGDFRRGQDHGVLQQSAIPRATVGSEHGPQRDTQELQRGKFRHTDDQPSFALPGSGQGNRWQ